jgi:arylsulfatase
MRRERESKMGRRAAVSGVLAAVAITAVSPSIVQAQDASKPNVLVIMGDDVGIPNISVYSHGMMGYQTPNIEIGRAHV